MDTVQVKVIFKNSIAGTTENGYIKTKFPISQQLEKKFIEIKLGDTWKHISTDEIARLWKA
ncbi:hypothetical protein I2750_13470 [Bacillus sp. PR5]|nr:hypothetical protein [Bacillus sp. PR5]